MALPIIDELEIVEIDKEERDRRSGSAGFVQRDPGAFRKETPVWQSREMVMSCELPEVGSAFGRLRQRIVAALAERHCEPRQKRHEHCKPKSGSAAIKASLIIIGEDALFRGANHDNQAVVFQNPV